MKRKKRRKVLRERLCDDLVITRNVKRQPINLVALLYSPTGTIVPMKKKINQFTWFHHKKPSSKPTLQSSSHPLIWPYRFHKSRLRVVTWNPDNQSTIFFYYTFFVRLFCVYMVSFFFYSLQYFMPISRCNRTNGKIELNHLSIFNA